MNNAVDFTSTEVGAMILIVSRLNPDTYTDTWAKAAILKARLAVKNNGNGNYAVSHRAV